MKKILYLSILILLCLGITGCFFDDKLTNNNVYTGIYPIYYLTNYLYGNEKEVSSIYPTGADINTYILTNKQKEEYQKGALFIYNGLTNEKELAKEFLNKNKDMLLIDASYGLNYDYDIEELWLSPNNFLMLAKNIKNNLQDYVVSKITKDNLDTKYKELEEKLSFMDADLRNIASQASKSGNLAIVVSSSKLKFLENYGFNVIVLTDNSSQEVNIKSNFKSGKYRDIYLCSTDEETEIIKDLKDNYNANIINVNMMYTLSEKDVETNEDYLTIMQDFIENIRNTALS